MDEELKSLLTGTILPTNPSLPVGKNKVLGLNVCYVVVGVVIEDGKVLMIQEAKPSCRGLWYLPAGRVEQKETLVEAVKREVKEEAGLEFEPQALVYVETQGMFWVRFTFSGKIVGGKLKTTAEADKESLQGGWFTSDVNKLPQEARLRLPDILPLIAVTARFQKLTGPAVMPTLVAHQSSLLKFVIVQNNESKLQVLQSKTPAGTLLPFSVDGGINFAEIALTIMKENGLSSGLAKDEVKIIGIISVEHDPQCKDQDNSDGVCLTLLVTCDATAAAKSGGGAWVTVKDELVVERLRNAMSGGTTCIRLLCMGYHTKCL